MLRLAPSTLALMAVQRQRAASKSAKPWSKAQHLLEGGAPTTMFTSPSRSAQTPSFNVSLGQEAGFAGGGGHAAGGGMGFGGLHEWQALVNDKLKRRREKTVRTAQVLLEAICSSGCYCLVTEGICKRDGWGEFRTRKTGFLKKNFVRLLSWDLIEWKRVKNACEWMIMQWLGFCKHLGRKLVKYPFSF
ncbi:hypothetical protein V6Z11_D13G222100, partial [Gossypium hirsutum]